MHKMLKLKCVLRICPAAFLFAALLFNGGCEADTNEDKSGVDEYFEENPYAGGEREDPLSSDLTIDPVLATISIVGGQAVFEGNGGVGPYTWSVGNSEYGTIEVDGWSEAVYTCLRVGNNTVRVEDQQGHSAVADITPVEDTLTIYPDMIDLVGDAYYAAFSVSGGTPPYKWSVGNVGMGTVSYSSDSSQVAGYTAVSGTYGVNVVTVTDSEGLTASASVTQSSEEDE